MLALGEEEARQRRSHAIFFYGFLSILLHINERT